MERRPRYRQRPAGEARGRRRPPQNYNHQQQHNNASCGIEKDEEHQKMRHSIKRKSAWYEAEKQTAPNQTEQVLRQEVESQVQSEYQDKEAQKKKGIDQMGADLLKLSDEKHHLRLRMDEAHQKMCRNIKKRVARYEAEKQTASNQTEQVSRQEVESQVQSEYQEKEAQMRKQIDQMGADLLKLRDDKHSLRLRLDEAHTAMSSKDAALQQSEEAWQRKYEALSQKIATDMEATDMEATNQKWETEEKQFTIKVSLMEEQLHQRELEILRLTEDNNGLVKKLAETTQEAASGDAQLLQSQTDWQDKFQTLRDNFCNLEESQRSWEAQQTQSGVEVEAEISQRDADIIRLTEDNASLSQKLFETAEELKGKDAELLQSQIDWEDKFQSLRDNFRKDLEESQRSWEAQQTQSRVKVEAEISRRDADIIRLTEDNASLSQKLFETAEELKGKDAELLQSQTDWEDKFQTLRDNVCNLEGSEQSWEAQQTQSGVKVEAEISQRDADIIRLTEDNASLSQKLSKTAEELKVKDAELLLSQTAWQDKYTALEKVTDELAQKQQSLETEVRQLVADKTELEDLCLYINKKRRRFLLFPRRSSDDRETQLQKMKIKMQQRASKTRGDEKEEEEMEAADSSAQAGHQ